MSKFFQHENVLSQGSISSPLERRCGGLLIANRGEIAARVIQAAQKSGIRTATIYAADDASSLHVSMADEAFLLSGETLAETYLNQEKIIQIALNSGVEAIHPGYGFLSENAGFAQKVADSGLVFIGPSPENIRLMGEKNQALAYVKSLGISVLTSFSGTVDELLQKKSEMDFPVVVKASGGGGGKGMVICYAPEELLPALQKAERQALSYFENGDLLVEKFLPRARHIEVQLLADQYGNVLHFYERECTIQRRFQKIIEEAPSPSVDAKLRVELTSAAVKIAKSMDYCNAGTIEFLLDENGHFYFLEMNTRIQVEHPVTEMITNTDLVALQLQVSAGNKLTIKQEDIRISGHAIEVRLCAEDATNQFQPSAGELVLWRIPDMEHLRVETFVKEGNFITPNYDSLLAKLIVWGETREIALLQMQQVLLQTCISGVHTNLSFLSGLIESEPIRKNRIYTRYVDENLDEINQQVQERKNRLNKHEVVIAYLIFYFQQENHSGSSVWNQIGFWRMMLNYEVSIDGETYKCQIESARNGRQLFRINPDEYQVSAIRKSGNLLEMEINLKSAAYHFTDRESETIIFHNGFTFSAQSNLFINQVSVIRKDTRVDKIFQNLICADLFGKVLKLNVSEGDTVYTGQILLTLESMKTEIHVLCPVNSRVGKIHVEEGKAVVEKQLLVELEQIHILSPSA